MMCCFDGFTYRIYGGTRPTLLFVRETEEEARALLRCYAPEIAEQEIKRCP